MGMTPAYIARAGHWPDLGAPQDPAGEGVPALPDLSGVLDLV
jgi:hypothetical protein